MLSLWQSAATTIMLCALQYFKINERHGTVQNKQWQKRSAKGERSGGFFRIRRDHLWQSQINACQKYFAAHIDKDMVCDILAGERVPPFKRMFTYVPGSRVRFSKFKVPGSLKFALYFPENFSLIPSKRARHLFTNLKWFQTLPWLWNKCSCRACAQSEVAILTLPGNVVK